MEKIIRKSILLVFLIILLLVSTFGATKDNKFDENASNYSIENKKDYARNFINLIIYGEYSSAYDMLTDDCKNELADNDVSKFEEIMKTYIYEHGKISKTFYYKDPVECANEGEQKVYSQQVTIVHQSLGSIVGDINSFGYNMQDYTKINMLNFIIYENKPYDYKISLQLVE